MDSYNDIALRYAEKYGITDYVVKGNKMFYQENFSVWEVYDVVVNLDMNVEISRQRINFKLI